MEVKFEHAVTVLLSIQVILFLMTYSVVSEYLTEDEDGDYYKDSCSCYCDYPYYWYGYNDVYEVPIGILEADGTHEDNSTASNDTA